MRNSKKGFTFVELLAIIVILGVLVTLATTRVINIMKTKKQDVFKQEANAFIEAARIKSAEVIVPNEGICYSLSDLSDYVDKDLTGYSGSVFVGGVSNYFMIWLSKDPYLINGSTSSNISVIKPNEFVSAGTNCPGALTVTILADGGILNGSSSFVISEGMSIDIPNPIKTGYTFSHWEVIGEGSSINGSIFTMGTENAILTANYIANNYILTIDAKGGTYNGTNPLTIASRATEIINHIPTRTNYLFDGWVVTGEGSSFNDVTNTFTMGTENATLEAKWELNAFTLTVNSNGGIWDGTTPQTLVVGTSTIIEEPTKAGHVFNEWTVVGEGSSFNETTNEFTMGSENTTITANWLSYMEMFTYTIDGKSGASGTDYELILEENDWKIKFLTSGTFTPLADMEIDAFLVGGGGSGGSQNGGGGGGGYTKTEVGLDIAKNDGIQVIIGAGGNGVAHPNYGNDGGATLFGNISVAGGIGGNGWSYTKTNAGSGGSGGGCFNKSGAYGGSDGYDGLTAYVSAYNFGGTGQGFTTREFGEADGTLYAGGGAGLSGSGGSGGGGAYGVSGTPNTGGGGGGSNNGVISGAGGSGIVVIRKTKYIKVGNTNKYKFRYSGSYIVEDGATDNWKIKLLSSGTLYSANSLEIDAFLVGGGASGGSQAGGGGGGGYTKTEPGVTITENEAIPVIIGAGGKGVLHPNCGNDGEATLFGNISVAGGIGGNGWSCSKAGAGSGGSGGGCFNKSGAYGGSDGGNGFSSGSYAGGTGQGSTTREFGEADGTLYAGGGGGNTGAGGAGGGGAYGTFGVSGTRNTGGGGGGGGNYGVSGAGGSGIVVIRNSRNISP